MAGRRCFCAIVLLAAILHALGIARARLPAQDGLKFIRIARQFTRQPWTDVVRSADQHPLYPALIAACAPVVAALRGPGPDTWRIAAQFVSAIAALALLFPLFGLVRILFDERIACFATFLYVLLPFPAAIGHDTLSDSLALFAFVLALRFGVGTLRMEGLRAAVGCGLAAGCGFLARPEVALVPVAVLLTAAPGWRGSMALGRPLATRLATLAVSFLVLVGGYALVKGEVSEKLALRNGAALSHRPVAVRAVEQWLPPGLNDPRWDFSAKEEPGDEVRSGVVSVAGRLVQQWAEGLGWVFAVFALWGVARERFLRRVLGCENTTEPSARRLIVVYLALFSLVLLRHALKMGYLSGRHVLTLVILTIPWSAAGMVVCARGIATRLRWSARRAQIADIVGLTVLMACGVVVQLKPSHPSRWGHRAAGQWLAAHAGPSDAVLDTRGWAAFVSGRPSYDYWHVRQALTDAHLAYVVVGTDELTADSRRAATLRAVLAYAATPVAGFPERIGGAKVGVQIFRYAPPQSWEGLRP